MPAVPNHTHANVLVVFSLLLCLGGTLACVVNRETHQRLSLATFPVASRVRGHLCIDKEENDNDLPPSERLHELDSDVILLAASLDLTWVEM